jgi:hypothetical protein
MKKGTLQASRSKIVIVEGLEESSSRASVIEESHEIVSAYQDSEGNISGYHRSSTVLEDNTNLPLDVSKSSAKSTIGTLPTGRLVPKTQISPTKTIK